MRRQLASATEGFASGMGLMRMSSSGLFFFGSHSKPGGIASSAFNLASATLGAGTLALPYSFIHCGSVISTSILLCMCVLTIYSVFLLVTVSEITGLSSFPQLSYFFFGRGAERATVLLVFLFCWGCAVVYVVAAADILDVLREGFGYHGFLGRKLLTTIFWALFMLPLSLPEEITSLQHAAFVGVMSSVVLVIAITAHCIFNTPVTIHSVPYTTLNYDTFSAAVTFVFAYCCQPVVFQVYTELNRRTAKRMTLAAGMGMSVCSVLYIVVGFFGAANFGFETRDNVLKNFKDPFSEAYIAFAFVCFIITVTLAFPINTFPTRDALLQAMGYAEGAKGASQSVRLVVTSLAAFSALLAGLFVPSIRVLFALFGGICGGSVGFVLPALYILASEEWTVELVGRAHVTMTWLLLIIGVIVTALGTYTGIADNFLSH